MIKLTIHLDTQPITHTFNKTVVIIGSNSEGPVDLTLPGELLETVHVVIQEQGGRFSIINQANDPFVTLNGLSFAKKYLHNNDLIQIGNTVLRFEATQITKTPPISGLALEESLASKIHANASSKSTYSFPEFQEDLDVDLELERLENYTQNSGVSEAWKAEDLDNLDIDALISQVEDLEKQHSTPRESHRETSLHPPQVQDYSLPEPHVPSFKHGKGSLKDDYFYDEEIAKEKAPAVRWNWNLIWKLIGASIAFLLLILAIIYFSMSGKNNEEEIKAAQGASDVAMALSYTQMHNTRFQNQNWSDPDFIKNNLSTVLAPQYTPAFSVDAHGQLGIGPYLIRIYTSSDLSQFLVIAQPAPSLLQWLLPKASLVVDSKYMQIRKVTELKTLNRLLLKPNTLEGINATEISALIAQGELVPLSSLAFHGHKQGFNPPKVLGSIRPGADNLIYNAPRYYRFGEEFMKDALAIADRPRSSTHDPLDNVAMLQEELKKLSKYPQIVLYSSQGLQGAIHAQKALNIFLPNHKFLVAYLKFNPKGTSLSSHLLIDEGSNQEVAVGPSASESTPTLKLPLDSQETPSASRKAPSTASEDVSTESTYVDAKHPLFLKLLAVKSEHQQSFNEFETDILSLVNTPNRPAIMAFIERMEKMLKKGEKNYSNDPEKLEKTIATEEFLEQLRLILKKYDESHSKHDEEMVEALTTIYKEYTDQEHMAFADFMEYIKAAGLESFVLSHLALYEEAHTAHLLPPKHLEEQLQKVKSAKTLSELHGYVGELADMLVLKNVPDPALLISYQTDARSLVLDKLNNFLLSSDQDLPPDAFTEENRSLLAHIMILAWVTDPEEFDYYINEFELRTPTSQN